MSQKLDNPQFRKLHSIYAIWDLFSLMDSSRLFQSLNHGNPILWNMYRIFLRPPQIHLNLNIVNQSIKSFLEFFLAQALIIGPT